MQLFQEPHDGDTITIPAGIHHIPEPIRISGANIRIVGLDGARLQAVMPLTDHVWHPWGKAWCTTVDRKADALYIGDHKYTMARYPKHSSDNLIFGGYASDCTEPEKVRTWRDPAGGYIHALHAHLWGGYTYRIAGKREDDTLFLEGGWQNNRQMGMHDQFKFAENIFEELTEPGEWYFDEQNMRLFVIPREGDDLKNAVIAVSHCFFQLENCRNVTIENITFERSSRTFMETREPLLRSDWTIFRGGAVYIRNSRDCSLDRCTFRDIGSNAVFADGNNENIRITRTLVQNTGASGICFVGRPDSVRSPLFEYSETQPLAAMDKTPGPKSENYPRNCLVEDCLITHTGETEKQSAGIQISMAQGIRVRNCTVCHMPRAGINISEGTFGGHVIDNCDVFDTVRETGDHGSFNSWGRDRYWNAEGLAPEDAGQYALLDCVAPNRITNSRWRCDHGWDIDLDDGSSHYVIENNLCLAGGIKLREGFFRTVRHNITLNNTLHLHAWYPASGDTIEGNILFDPYSTYSMPENWGSSLDGNYLHTPRQQEPTPAEALQARSHKDLNSLSMDCGFRKPEEWDFRPANVDGFEDFPTEFGVRHPPLRALADVPEFPHHQENREPQDTSTTLWYGATVKNITNDGEMSVYGTAGYSGALILDVLPDSPAEQQGLIPQDVIVKVGSKNITNIFDLDLPILGNPITLLRRQRKIEV